MVLFDVFFEKVKSSETKENTPACAKIGVLKITAKSNTFTVKRVQILDILA
ncbi:MAG: hypothetical protein QGG63_01190 [Candidatus Pacebacteria bacterium]|jgi:hypothetical protein|nr:hypothetical protein [Candidatus Paceibacterota bacterium]|tara:strand:+ start:315 stop:467 length:153 start_codon:yes stop_codon:yes gene_type:complete